MRINYMPLYLTLIATLLTGCGMIFPHVYSSQSIEGWVVDSETGEPLKDVVVVADWIIWGGLEGGSHNGHIVHEAVTDATGHYYIPEWGPKQMSTTGSFQSSDPWLIFFKEQYEYTAKGNDTFSEGYLGYSRWNGKTIKLKQFQGDLQAYGKHQNNLDRRISNIFEDGDGCGWQNIPMMLIELAKETRFFEKNGMQSPFQYYMGKNSYLFRHSDIVGRECDKTPQQFFGSYLQ